MIYLLPFILLFSLASGSMYGGGKNTGSPTVLGKEDYKCMSPCAIDDPKCRCQ